MTASTICACLLLVSAIAGCAGDGRQPAAATATQTPQATATPTEVPENQFGFRDTVLRAGAARVSIAPVRAGSADALANPEQPAFEIFTDFDVHLTCPDAPEVQLHLQPNALFDGVLTKPAGEEPWLDCGERTGQFDEDVDVYADLNENGAFDGDPRNPEGLEPFDDVNGNGRFDAIWMGGFDSARAARGVDPDAPPAVTALVLSRGLEFSVLVTLDTIGDVSTHLSPLRQRVAAELGLDGSSTDSPDVQRVIVSSLHDHESADTIGVAGPTALSIQAVHDIIVSGLLGDLGLFAGVPVRSGINFEYREWIDEQVVEAVQQAVADLRPAVVRVGTGPAPMRADADVLAPAPVDQSESFLVPRRDQLLMTDIRWPFVRDPIVLAFQAVDAETGEAIATLANWSNHVEVLGSRNSLLSADYAGAVRQHLESLFGGVGIFAVSAVGGLQTPLQDVFVPVVDAAGDVVAADGSRTPFADLYAAVLDGERAAGDVAEDLFAMARRAEEESAEKSMSLGRIVAEVAALSLRQSEPRQQPFTVSAATALIPLENPTLYLAAVLGVVEGREELFKREPSPVLVSDRAEQCGLIGCLRETITLVDFGDFQFLTTPGELLPEYVVGRPRAGVPQDEGIRFAQRDGDGGVVHDFGRNDFAPIRGLRELRGDNLFILGLAQGQLGYFIPQSDFVNVFEGSLPPPNEVDDLGIIANLNLAPLLNLPSNPGFEAGESLTVREIINAAWANFPEGRYPATSLGGVSLIDLPEVDLAADHPNVIGNNNSLGPRVGLIIYNAMCDLLDDGAANHSCPTTLGVDDDPNH